MDVVHLSRLQFALTTMFHYIFPPLTIGISVVIVFLLARHLQTKDPIYETAAKFWTRIFALNFAIGVASGIVLEFEFGTNWAVYSRFVGDVFGSALAAEGIFAFFLESGFLALLVFGWNRVGRKMHFFSGLMVALGSIFSSVWIVVANSWQQTPAGHHIVQMTRGGKPWFVNGVPVMRAEIVDFWGLVFNPSSINRLTHVLIGAFLMGSFFVMSVSAWYLLKGRHARFARRSFRGALLLATVSALAALFTGHLQAEKIAATQPSKLAAFEGHFETGPADLTLLGWPDPDAQTVHGKVAIPGMLSLLVHGDPKAEVIGLDRFRPEDRPPVLIPFQSYHLMVGLGVYFIGLTLLACFLLWRGRLFQTRWILWVFVFSVLAPLAANELGWIAAETGRQPWIVQAPMVVDDQGRPVLDDEGYVQFQRVEVPLQDGTPWTTVAGLRTDDAVSETARADQVLGSIILFALIYVLLGVLWVFLLNRKIQKGPEDADASGPPDDTPPGGGGLLGAEAARLGGASSTTGGL
jgi:cytochrome d ubiquinol oxidase subunit I